MRFHVHEHAAVLVASVMLAQWAAVGTVRADSGVGAEPGNALNPTPVNPSTAGRWIHPEGMGGRIPVSRTPSGLLYDIPLDPGEEPEAKEGGDWKASGFVEAGGLRIGGDNRSQGFRNYKDVKSGLYFNNFGVLSEKRDEARFVEAVGGGIGRHDAFYRFQFGRYNDWKVSAFYDETPQVFTATYRSLWNGLGSSTLSLSSLTPGGTNPANTTQTNIKNTLATTANTELGVIRRKTGARLDMNLTDAWKFYTSFTDEKRKGSRPFGAVFGGGGGGGNIEIAESINYETRDFLAGLEFSDLTSGFNLRASASFFRNDVDTMTFQNPLFVTLNGSNGLNPTTFTQGRFDLPPSNEHYNLKGEYARALPDFYRGNFTATVALGSMRQNDNLIAPTQFPLTGGTVAAGGASLANVWNTPAALSQLSAGARIDTRLADLGLSLKPASGLDVKGKLRYYETSNSMQYQSCNPLTGQWGRLLNDGSGLSLGTANTTAGVNPVGTSANAFNAANCNLAATQALSLVPSAGNIPIRSVPFDYAQLNTSLAADYRLGRASSVNAAIERESYRREYRERDRTWEDKIKLGYVDRGAIDGMIRLSYEHARRRGSEYNTNPYLPFLSASLGPTPAAGVVNMSSWIRTIQQFRKFDLADRDQNILNGRVNYTILPSLDGALTVQMKDALFPAQYGRTDHQKSNSLTLDLSYQDTSSAVLYGYYSYQSGRMEQKGVQTTGICNLRAAGVTATNWPDFCGTASATSPLFPENRGWDVASRDRNDVIGVGFQHDFGKVKLDTNFTRSLGRTHIGYTYNPAALGMTAVQVALAGNGLSDLTFAQNVFSVNALLPLEKDLSLRVLYGYESGKIRDWHYDGVAANPMPANNAVYLDAGPKDYRATTIGVLLHWRM